MVGPADRSAAHDSADAAAPGPRRVQRPGADSRIADDESDVRDESPTACNEAAPHPASANLEVGDDATLDATCSTDPLGDGLRYDWNTDEDGTFDARGETVTVSVLRCVPLEVRLRVTDSNGDTDTTSIVLSAD